MKLDHLPLGARFVYKGRVMSKVGPMTAAAEEGGTVFIPKHAVLKPVPGEAPPAPPQPDHPKSVDTARVLAAFEDYHRIALAAADERGRQALGTARARFLAALG